MKENQNFQFPTTVFSGSVYEKTGMDMKRHRVPTKFFAVEASEGNGKAGHVDLSTEEESQEESDSESEKTLLSLHRKSSSVTRKRARSDTSDSESDPEELNSASALEAPVHAVSSGVSLVSTVDSHPLACMLAFREVVDYVRTNCFSWQSHIDHSKETIVLYRLSVDCLIPIITHSVGLQFVSREKCISASSASKRIITKVCVEGRELDDGFVISAIKKSEICSEEDIGQLLKHVDVAQFRDGLLVASQLPAPIEMPFYRPENLQHSARRARQTLGTPLNDHSSASKIHTKSSSPPSALLQSIRADRHRERYRNTMLFRSGKSNVISRSALDVFAIGKPQFHRSPESFSAADMVEVNSFPEHGNDEPSMGSSVTGSDSCTMEETDQEPVAHFWHEPADNRARLMPHELYVNAWYLAYLQRNYNLKTNQRRTMSQAIHYGWDLVCHMLGGPAVICRRLKNAQSDQGKVASALLGVDIYKIVTGHVEHCFFSRKERAKEAFCPEGFTEAVNKKLFDLPSTQALTNEKVGAGTKRPALDIGSDGSDSDCHDDVKRNKKERLNGIMHDVYLKNTCKAPGRVGLSSKHPTFFIDKDKLEEIQRLHGLGVTNREGIQGIAWYGYKVMGVLLGGEETVRQWRMKLEKRQNGLCRMAGNKLFEVVLAHCHEQYPGNAHPDDKRHFKYWCSVYAKFTRDRDVKVANRNTLASALFVDDTTDTASVPTDLPCDAHVRYWSTPHPSRIQLHENHEYYVDNVAIAEYQRYFGPESALGEAAFTEYTYLVLQFLLGGEELVLRQLREHKRSASIWLKTSVDKDFFATYCGHVVRLFPAASLTEKKVRHTLDCKFSSQLILIRKGKGRLPKGVPYIDGKIPEQITLLDQQEYWRTPAVDRTQLRKGHDVYIETAFLHNTQDLHGPLSKDAACKKYAFVILEHMLGGEDVVNRARNDYVLFKGCRSMMRMEDVLALCLHTEETFHLSESLHPDMLFQYTKRRIGDRRRDRSDRKQKWVAKYSLKL